MQLLTQREPLAAIYDDRSRPRWRRFGLRAVGYGLLLLGVVLYLGPFLLQVVTSFKTDTDAANNPLSLVPDPATLDAWRTVGGETTSVPIPLGRWFQNSLVVTSAITLGRLVLDSLAGYALARLRFPGRVVLTAGLLAILAVPGIVLLIPRFLVLTQLDLFDTYAGMILPLLCDVVGILLMRTAFETVPVELEEAAIIDGAGPVRRLWSVALPLVRPALITVTILSFQGSWNEFTHFLVATSDPDLATLNLGIARLTGGSFYGPSQFPLKLALATLSTLPIAVVYVFFSRYFTRSIATSGIK
ncbi:MAG: carbohydrate ABC transporter permease [Acidimicrobiales bacterium]